MKSDERILLSKLVDAHGGPYNPKRAEFVDKIARESGINEKRAIYLCEKWEDLNLWDYGVSVRSGWFTPSGYEYAKGIQNGTRDRT